MGGPATDVKQPTIDLNDITQFYSKNGKGEMAEMNQTGDTKTVWDANDPDSVEAAKRQFTLLVTEKKYAAFAVNKEGDADKSRQIREFDPKIERIIFVKPLAGG